MSPSNLSVSPPSSIYVNIILKNQRQPEMPIILNAVVIFRSFGDHSNNFLFTMLVENHFLKTLKQLFTNCVLIKNQHAYCFKLIPFISYSFDNLIIRRRFNLKIELIII